MPKNYLPLCVHARQAKLLLSSLTLLNLKRQQFPSSLDTAVSVPEFITCPFLKLSIFPGSISLLALSAPLYLPPGAKGRAASWLARSGNIASQQALSSILIRSEFSAVGLKKSLAVLAARLGPLGHGQEFGGFLYPGKPVWLPLNEKTVGPFPPPVEFFLSFYFSC